MSRSFLRDLARAVGARRRLLASLAAAATVYFTLTALSPAPPGTVAVLVAAHDLPGGAPLAARDVRTARLPRDVLPSGLVTRLDDRVLAGPVRAGEPLTDARFLAPGLVRRLPGDAVAYPVRIEDAEVAGLLRAGDRVDVLAAGATTATGATVVARSARVLSLPPPTDTARGALLVLGVGRETAGRIAQAAVNNRLAVVLTGDIDETDTG